MATACRLIWKECKVISNFLHVKDLLGHNQILVIPSRTAHTFRSI
jgi:hypothetical protein